MKLLSSVHMAELSGEYVLMDEVSGQFFGLNGTGSVFLRIIEEGINQDEALKELADIWKVNLENIKEDYHEFVQHLISKGLIELIQSG